MIIFWGGMMGLRNLITLVFILVLSHSVSAAVLVEPHLSYTIIGDGDYNGSDNSYSGLNYGGRLGLKYHGLMMGGDYSKSSLSYSEKSTTASRDIKYDRNQIGAFVGFRFPLFIRIWYTYYLEDKLTFKTTLSGWSTSGDYRKGTGDELGIGLTTLPFVSINFLYRHSTYKKFSSATATSGEHDLTPIHKTTEYALGFSIPFSL
jgi:hypothetical protein